MRRHPMWRLRRSRLAPLVQAAPAYGPMFDRIVVAATFGLFAMMALRVVLAWWEGRL